MLRTQVNPNPSGGMGRPSRRGGYSIVEVLLALIILILAALAFQYLVMSTVLTNRVDMARTAAVNSLINEFDSLNAIALDKSVLSGNPAKGLISYLKTDLAGRIQYDAAQGTVRWPFLVTAPGGDWNANASPSEEGTKKAAYGIGRAIVYLRADSVPADFLEWYNKKEDGTTTPSGATFFSYYPKSPSNEDFGYAITRPGTEVSDLSLQALPMTIHVEYFTKPVPVDNPDDREDFSIVYAEKRPILVSEFRHGIINDAVVKPSRDI